MSKARFYVYRNLNRGTAFSIKYKGIVQEIVEYAVLNDVNFVIQPAGQARARRERSRNVHAYVSPTSYTTIKPRKFREKYKKKVDGLREITYNPFKTDTFVYRDTGKPVHNLERAFLAYGKLYEVPDGVHLEQ